MTKHRLFAFLFLLLALAVLACNRKTQPEDPTAWNKVKIDFARLDKDGLAGPPSGKASAHYEFCIPAKGKYWKAVKKIDGTAEAQKGSKGRIGCDKGTWLVIGSTHQKNYRRVLYELASLPYVKEIQETYFE